MMKVTRKEIQTIVRALEYYRSAAYENKMKTQDQLIGHKVPIPASMFWESERKKADAILNRFRDALEKQK